MIQDVVINTVATNLIREGRLKLSQLYPRDFEIYMCALELVTPDGDTVDYFAFPIMPKSISKNEVEATSIQHGFNSTTVFNKEGYVPREISLQGDFGRVFKYVFFENEEYYRGLQFSVNKGYYTANSVNNSKSVIKKVAEIPNGIKTGFGCIKVLQSIIDKAKAHDATGRSFRLYFYNPALGESYLVVPKGSPLALSQQEQSSNMVWQYSLTLTVIADLNDVQIGKSVRSQKYLDPTSIIKSVQSTVATGANLLGEVINKSDALKPAINSIRAPRR